MVSVVIVVVHDGGGGGGGGGEGDCGGLDGGVSNDEDPPQLKHLYD